MKILVFLLFIFSFEAHGVDRKISELSTLSQGSWASGDLVPIVDISANATKKTSVADFDARYQPLGNYQASGDYVTATTGDVSCAGPGSCAATVNTVGGVSAANVASGANLANAATDANTASTIVKRTSGGAFSITEMFTLYVRLADGGALPTCNSGTRGRMAFVYGSTLVADSVQVCKKNALDAYAWATLL